MFAAIECDTMAPLDPVAEALQAGDLDAALRRSIDAAAGDPGWFDRQPEERRRVHRDTATMLPLVFRQTPPIPLGATELAAIRCLTTLAWGEDTRDCYWRVSAAAADAIPQAWRVEVADAGHLLPEQAPECFADLVLEHLDRAHR